jgi:hypothetical protein
MNIKQYIKQHKYRILISLFAVIVALTLPLYDKIAKTYVNESLKNSAISYAIARAINAGVSVIQESSVTVGVGLEGNIALGQVLDPINDATERFSDLLTLSLWATGAEKAVYEISKLPLFTALILLLAILNLIIKSDFSKNLLLIFIVVRIFLPFSAAISLYLDKYYFTPKITQINNSLKPMVKEVKISEPAQTGFWNKIKNSFQKAGNSLQNIEENAKFYITNASKIISSLLNLASIYLSQFILNVLIFPLLLIYILKNLMKLE